MPYKPSTTAQVSTTRQPFTALSRIHNTSAASIGSNAKTQFRICDDTTPLGNSDAATTASLIPSGMQEALAHSGTQEGLVLQHTGGDLSILRLAQSFASATPVWNSITTVLLSDSNAPKLQFGNVALAN
jgi:hypothetical protein